jgi:hypothetical protein
MKKVYFFIAICFISVSSFSQKVENQSEKEVKSDFSNYPSVSIDFWTRSSQKLNKNEIGILEDGKKVAVENVNRIFKAGQPVAKNKYVLILLQNHYSLKGIDQRIYFKNLINQGLSGRIKRGDKYIVATFDWYRQGKYINFEFGETFTDNNEELLNNIFSISSPSSLDNEQKGSDIYAALNEALDFFTSIKDTLPKNVVVLSDDFPNIVSSVTPAQVAEKSQLLDIPIYGISHNIGSSRYNKVMENEICKKSNGNYYLSPNNNPKIAGDYLASFIDSMNIKSLGVHQRITYKSVYPRTGEAVKLQIDIKDQPSKNIEVDYPFDMMEWIKARPWQFVIAFAILVAFILILIFTIKWIKKRKIEKIIQQQEQDFQLKKNRDELEKLHHHQEELKSKYERDQQELNTKLQKERLTNMLNSSGQKVNLIYTYQGKTTVIPMPGIEFTIGRAPQNNLVLDLPFVSKSHLILSFGEDGKFYVKDLKSTNGSLLNNVRFYDKVAINNGDIISIGMIDIKFSQVK